VFDPPHLAVACAPALLSPPPKGVGACEASCGNDGPELGLVDVPALDAPPPKDTNAFEGRGGNAEFSKDFADGGGTLALNGVGALKASGGKVEVPKGFDGAGALDFNPLKGVGALEDRGGKAEVPNGFA